MKIIYGGKKGNKENKGNACLCGNNCGSRCGDFHSRPCVPNCPNYGSVYV